MSFANPAALYAMLALVPLAAVYALSYRRGRRDLGYFAALPPRQLAHRRDAGKQTDPRKLFLFKRFFEALLTCVAIGAVVLAVAGIRWGEAVVEETRIGSEVVVLIDLSRSMTATDTAPSRLARAVTVATAVVEQRAGEEFAVVGFGDRPHLLLPFTRDHVAVAQQLAALRDAELAGSALGEAVAFATALAGKAGSARVLLLLSDGEADAGAALEAARRAGTLRMPIVAVPVGTVEGGIVDVGDSAVTTRADRALLDQLAEASGGLMVEAEVGAEQIAAVSRRIERVSATTDGRSFRVEPVERYPLLAMLAVLAVLLGQAVRRVRWHGLF